MTDPTSLSPLASSDPDAMSLLFSSDPSTLSDADFTSLITEVRRRRSEFHSTEAARQSAPKVSRGKRPPPISAADSAKNDKPLAEFTLDDL